jgi:hypothetical protein
MKICANCKKEKPLDLFQNDKRLVSGKNSWCISCARELVKKIRATKKGLANSRSASINYARNHHNGLYARLKTDPLFKLTHNLRNLIRNSIKNQGYKKTTKTAAILGCDYEFFHLYMELQFKPGMSWENHGEWHIDHKKPISWAKTKEEVIKLNHYTNLQPLWAVENIQKGNRYAN